jgi:hypothetical protein
MGGQGNAGGGSAPEPTDASGLLGGQRAFSPNGAVAPDEVGAGGAVPGGAGLSGLGEERRPVPPSAGTSGAESGQPGGGSEVFLPYLPGTGPGNAAGPGPEPTDASGLLDGEAAMPGDAEAGPGAGRAEEREAPPANPSSPAERTDAAEDVAAWGAGVAAGWILTGRGRGTGRARPRDQDEGFPPEGDDPPSPAAGDESQADWAGTGLVGWRRVSGGSGPGSGEYPVGGRRLRVTDAPYEGEASPAPAETEEEPEEDEADRIGKLLIEESTLWGMPVDDLGDLE